MLQHGKEQATLRWKGISEDNVVPFHANLQLRQKHRHVKLVSGNVCEGQSNYNPCNSEWRYQVRKTQFSKLASSSAQLNSRHVEQS